MFPEATISINLSDSWQVSDKRTNYPHLVESTLYEDEKSATNISLALFRLNGKDPVKTAKFIIDMDKQTGTNHGKIDVKVEKTMENGQMVHLTHTPNNPKFMKKLDKVRVIYWNKDWSFFASCKIQLEQKDIEKLPSLIKACTDIKVQPKAAK